MRRLGLRGLRGRLLLSTLIGSLLAVSLLVAAFNLVLDGKLRGEVDNLLRDRAAAELRTVAVVDGRISISETPDKAAPDTQTWVFAGQRTLEQPIAASASQRAAIALSTGAPRALTVEQTDTRLHAVPIVENSARLGTVVVGASLSPYESSARTALVGSLILGLLTIMGIAAASAWVTGRALAPVARMTAAAADWSERDLSRRFFVGQPHDELTELAATFDRLLDRASQSLKREQRLTAEISHELRTPLAKILAEAELADREREPERQRQALESIRGSAESLGGTLNALLASARSEIPAGSSSADARAVAERAARQAAEAADRHGVAIHVDGASELRVAAEPALVERALAPLIENAARFARRRVDISVRSVANEIAFEVHDDGPGVEPRIRNQIFEPGVRQGGGDAGSGAGLGLPLARRLARAAGGDVDQIGGASGATFALRLPAA
jgi:two-component system, OmpR family, sensor kinase